MARKMAEVFTDERLIRDGMSDGDPAQTGAALQRIRDNRDYIKFYASATFEEYLRKHWNTTLQIAEECIAQAIRAAEDAPPLAAVAVVEPEPAALAAPAPAPADLAPAMTREELDAREAVIRTGYAAFVEVGLALLDIRDRRGYKHLGYATFEEYMIRRWDLGRSRGYQLIEQTQVVQALETGENVQHVGHSDESEPGISGRAALELARLKVETPADAGGDGRKKELDVPAIQQADRVARELYGARPSAAQMKTVVDALEDLREDVPAPDDATVRAAVEARRAAQERAADLAIEEVAQHEADEKRRLAQERAATELRERRTIPVTGNGYSYDLELGAETTEHMEPLGAGDEPEAITEPERHPAASTPSPRRTLPRRTAAEFDQMEALNLRVVKVADILRRRADWLERQMADPAQAPLVDQEVQWLRQCAEYTRYEAVDYGFVAVGGRG